MDGRCEPQASTVLVTFAGQLLQPLQIVTELSLALGLLVRARDVSSTSYEDHLEIALVGCHLDIRRCLSKSELEEVSAFFSHLLLSKIDFIRSWFSLCTPLPAALARPAEPAF